MIEVLSISSYSAFLYSIILYFVFCILYFVICVFFYLQLYISKQNLTWLMGRKTLCLHETPVDNYMLYESIIALQICLLFTEIYVLSCHLPLAWNLKFFCLFVIIMQLFSCKAKITAIILSEM